MVGADAKELIINNNIPEALNKIKELVNIVKKEPYMDITTESILDEELEKKESLREELSSLIDNKNYEALDSNALNNRINYIKEAISSNSAIIEKYQNEINSIDEFVNSTLSTAITDLENELLALEKSLTEAHNLLKENKIPRTKANLESTITKKEKERDILNNILNSYKANLISKIASTNKLEEFITLNRDENEKLSLELEKLNKLSLLDLKTRDLVHEEEDKEKLKALNEEIKALKNRQKFSKTPDEIFDEIDMYLASLKSSEPVKEPLNSQPERLKVVEIIPVETVKAETGGN